MTNVIVVFSRPEDARSIKNILTRSGFEVVAVCTSGAQALNYADSLNSGIIVCGYRLEDMPYCELHDCMPKNFEMLLLASPDRCSGQLPEDLVYLPMPLKVHDLIHTMEMIAQSRIKLKKKQKLMKKSRTEEEKRVIDQAKALLMERNNMSESEAHRYIQKCSMDSGTNLIETAHMVLSLISNI